jgi:hypothetical protein
MNPFDTDEQMLVKVAHCGVQTFINCRMVKRHLQHVHASREFGISIDPDRERYLGHLLTFACFKHVVLSMVDVARQMNRLIVVNSLLAICAVTNHGR